MATEKRENPAGDQKSRKRKGKLLLIGGNEDKIDEMEVLRTLAKEAGGAEARIEVITTASSEPEKTWQTYKEAFKKIEAGHVKPLHIASRAQAEEREFIDRIAQSTALLLSGGDQLRITSILEATPVAEAIRRHYFEEGKLVAGTSAGAAALTSTIIYDGESPEALRKGAVKMTGGLALISNAVVDTHFVSRGRFGRLFQVVAGNPRLIGVGLGEDTGVLVTGGTKLKVVGSGLVIIVDGGNIRFTNVFEVEHMEPFSVENIAIHVLSSGAGYDLDSRSFLPPPPKRPKPEDSQSR
ncbi:cyanophycinase [Elusimicrobiota bacterium]